MKRLIFALFGLVVLAPPAAAQTATVMEYYHLDAVGSVRAVTDQTGTVIRRHDDDPFGQELPTTPTGTDTPRFTGKERDPETSQHYFGARYYNSVVGRFMSVDPAGAGERALVEPQRWNRYAYGNNNPLRFTDPDGRNPLLIMGAAGSAVYGGWQVYQNLKEGRPWYDNVGVEAGKGFVIGASLGLAAPALAASSTAAAIASAPTAVATFGFTQVEGVIEGYTFGRLANGAQVAARFSRSGDTLTTSVLGAFNPENGRALGTLSNILQGAQAVARQQGATQLVIQAVGVINRQLADILVRQGFTQTTVLVGNETVVAYEKTFAVR